MPRHLLPALPVRLFFVAGGCLVAVALAGVVVSLTQAELIRSRIPGLAVDAATVGGAAMALSLAVLALGVAQLALGTALVRRFRWSPTAAITFDVAAAMLLLACSVTAWVTLAHGSGALYAGIALVLMALAACYGAAAAVLIGQKART